MQRTMMKSKIHRAGITACYVDYIGSITIDADLMDSDPGVLLSAVEAASS